ncbi:MAG: elongation factor G [Deltaproteobacteria bacterium]|nr:elongation factor G [Deltaproteobacteria bacterium]
MATQDLTEVRNLAVVGHGGVGKTSFCEAALFNAKVTTRLNRVDEGNSILDYSSEEIERKSTLSSSMAVIPWKKKEIFCMDTPGYTNFLADTKGVLKVMDSAVVLVSAVSGVKVETEKVWGYLSDYGLASMIFVNKMDRERSDFFKAIEMIESTLEARPLVMQLPLGKEADFTGVFDLLTMESCTYTDGKVNRSGEIPAELKEQVDAFREKLVETAVETDDDLMERYLEGGVVTDDEIRAAIAKGTTERQFVPVYCGAALPNIGVDLFLDGVISFLPAPDQVGDERAIEGVNPENDELVTREPSPNAPLVAQVYKTVVDPFAGKLNFFRVFSGVMKADSTVWNSCSNEKERVGTILRLTGKEQKSVPEVGVGEIAAVAKLKNTVTGDTLCSESAPVRLSPILFPEPVISFAVEAKSKGDEDKLGQALSKIAEEEPALKIERREETSELVVSVMGMVHMEVILARMKQKFGVEVDLKEPKIPYKETIRKKSEVQGKYKKQTGGHGQFGDVWIRFEPLPKGSGFEFAEEIVGGAVPRQFIPAVEKGLTEAIRKGPLAGYPMVDFKATLYDGSYHSVDSSEMAFKVAASMALKKGCLEAAPVLLEPIMKMQIMVPDDFVGGVISDLNSRRGKVLGVDARGSTQIVSAEVPMVETMKYVATLRSITGGRGSFELSFDHYAELPAHLSDKVISEAKSSEQSSED